MSRHIYRQRLPLERTRQSVFLPVSGFSGIALAETPAIAQLPVVTLGVVMLGSVIIDQLLSLFKRANDISKVRSDMLCAAGTHVLAKVTILDAERRKEIFGNLSYTHGLNTYYRPLAVYRGIRRVIRVGHNNKN